MSEGYRLPGVEVFAAGQYRGRRYTTRDLDDVVRNFERFSGGRGRAKVLLRVPSVIGHDEDQRWLQASNLPAAGWVESLRRRGDKLVADVGGVPEQVARLLRGGAYRTVSAELYDRPPRGLPGEGMTLRRVAFLGGEIPEVKGLADIPAPEAYAERPFASPAGRRITLHPGSAVRLPGGAWAAFSEARTTMPETNDAASAVQVPPREDMVKRLAEHGMDVSAVDERTPDHTLAEMVRVCDAKDERPPHEMDEDEWREPEGDEKKREYAERARKYRERAHKFSCKYDEGYRGRDATDLDTQGLVKGKGEGPEKMSEKDLASVVAREVARALAADKGGTLAELQRFREETLVSERRRAVEAFCETQAAAGRLTPAEYQPKAQGGPGGPVFRRLMRADARAKAEKFSERGRVVELTELEAQQREIEQRPTLFGERFRQPEAATGQKEAELAKFSEHYDLHEQSFRGIMSRDEWVGWFEAERKRRPELTADELINRHRRR